MRKTKQQAISSTLKGSLAFYGFEPYDGENPAYRQAWITKTYTEVLFIHPGSMKHQYQVEFYVGDNHYAGFIHSSELTRLIETKQPTETLRKVNK